jgi:hypothetical protein
MDLKFVQLRFVLQFNKLGTSSANTSSWQVVGTALIDCMCSPRLSRLGLISFGERIERTNDANGLLTTCYKVVELNRLVTICYNNLLSSCGNLIQHKQHCYNLTRKNLTSCRKSANKLCSHCSPQVVNKFGTSCWQLWQPCWHCQTCGNVVPTSSIQSWYNNIVTTLSRQPCNILFISRLYQTCSNKLGKISAEHTQLTSCRNSICNMKDNF